MVGKIIGGEKRGLLGRWGAGAVGLLGRWGCLLCFWVSGLLGFWDVVDGQPSNQQPSNPVTP